MHQSLHTIKRLPSMDQIKEAREAATERAFAFLEETVRSCFHRNPFCECEEIMDILDAAGRLEECSNCEGRGRVNWHRSTYSSPAEPCDRGCDSRLCREDDCKECFQSRGKVIAS